MGVLVIADGDGLSVLAAMNAALASLGKGQKGTSRPADAGAGTLWWDGDTPSTTLWGLNLYNGTSDIEVARADITNSKMRFVNAVFDEVRASSVAASGTVDLGAQVGNSLDITGNTTITSFGTSQAGIRRNLRFTGTPQITYNATSMILPGGVNLIAQAGDVAEFLSLGSGNWVCTSWLRATGGPTLGWHMLDTQSLAGATYIKDNIPSWVNHLDLVVDLIPVTNNVSLNLTARKSSGTDIAGTSYNTVNTLSQFQGSLVNALASGAFGTSSISMISNIQNTANSGGAHARMLLTNIQSARYKRIFVAGGSQDSTYWYSLIAHSRVDDAAALTGVKLSLTSGNFSDGRATLYGSM